MLCTITVRLPIATACLWTIEQRERRYESPRSRQTVSEPNNDIGRLLARGLKISFAAGVGVLVVVVHISIYLTGHGFHHGH
jgi:hypothetical protein